MDLARLRTALLDAAYTTDTVLERITAAGQDGLGRNSTIPASTMLDGAADPTAVLIRLFVLQHPVAATEAERVLPVAELLDVGLLRRDADQITAVVDLRPYNEPGQFLVSDLTPGLDGRPPVTHPSYVLGASPASLTLTQITMRQQIGRALDLGTGCGVQTIHLAGHTDGVVATDLNPRAVELVRIGLDLSGTPADLREGSLFEPVVGERFDLIVSNPPYVMSPPGEARLTYREGGFTADGLTEAIVRQAPAFLNPGGSLQLLTNWAIIRDQPWEERLRSWVEGSGCDAWIIERERLDRFAYIEMWLTDAGLAGTEQWAPQYRRWLDYFEQEGIDEVGMGWLLLTRAERETPHVRIESWPHAVAQPVGEVFERHRAAVDAATLPDAALLQLQPRLADVVQETTGEPGAEDPQHIVLRQRTGLLRGMKLSTVTGAILGACDGELPLGAIMAAVAQILAVDPAEVHREALPVLRDALLEQYLLAD